MRKIQLGCIEEGRRRKTKKKEQGRDREEWKRIDERGEKEE